MSVFNTAISLTQEQCQARRGSRGLCQREARAREMGQKREIFGSSRVRATLRWLKESNLFVASAG